MAGRLRDAGHLNYGKRGGGTIWQHTTIPRLQAIDRPTLSAEETDRVAEHGLGHIPIRTRATGDHRPDTVLKAEWLDEGRTPDLVFEDRASVVALWRSRGIVCCQVAPGDF